MRACITDVSLVLGENDNGRSMVEFCAERGLCVGNTYFEHKSFHKYTRMARGQDGMEVKSMINLVLVEKVLMRYLQIRPKTGSRREGRGTTDEREVGTIASNEEGAPIGAPAPGGRAERWRKDETK